MRKLIAFLFLFATIPVFGQKTTTLPELGQKIRPVVSQSPRYKIAQAIHKWMGDKSTRLPLNRAELKKLFAYKKAGYLQVVFCPGMVDFVHLHRGKSTLRIGDVRFEGGSPLDVPIVIVGTQIVSVGPDCDECEDSRIHQVKRGKRG